MRTVRRAAALRALWEAVSSARRPGTPGVGERLRAVPRMVAAVRSGAYPADRRRLGLVLLALVYVVSPVDLVPEAALWLLGLGDDALVTAWLAGAVLSETEAFLRWERGERDHQRQDPGRTVPGEVL